MTDKEKTILDIKELDISEDMKNILLEMNELYWNYANWTPDTRGFDYRVAEGVELCMKILKKHAMKTT